MNLIKPSEYLIDSFKQAIIQICKNATDEEGVQHNVHYTGQRVCDITPIGETQMCDLISLALSWNSKFIIRDDGSREALSKIVSGVDKKNTIETLVVYYEPSLSLYTLTATLISDNGSVRMDRLSHSVHVYEQDFEFCDGVQRLIHDKIMEIMAVQPVVMFHQHPEQRLFKKTEIKVRADNGEWRIHFDYFYAQYEHTCHGSYEFTIKNFSVEFKGPNEVHHAATMRRDYESSGIMRGALVNPDVKIKGLLRGAIRGALNSMACNDPLNETGLNPNGLFS